jgi:hypothetical protein
MNPSFKPRVEKLEDRLVMDAAGTHVLYQDVFIPAPSRLGEVALASSLPDAESSQAVSGRVTGIASDPMGGVSPGWGASSYQYAFSGTYALPAKLYALPDNVAHEPVTGCRRRSGSAAA